MNRRDFILRSSASVAGISLIPSMLTSCNTKPDPLYDIGLITNLVKNSIREDHRATMQALAEMGYRYLEFGGTYDEEPAELLSFMKEIGLKPLAGGSSMSGLQGDDLLRQIDACLEMEKKYLVCYYPWMVGADQIGQKDVDTAIEQCNHIASVCKAQGLDFAWHNHEWEFGLVGERVIIDYMLEHTSEDVLLQIDLFWAHKGGGDVRELFEKYPGRFPLVHVKDSTGGPERGSFACVGEGIIDFEEILAHREVAGFKHLIVEHDNPDELELDELACARTSIENIHSLKF